MVDWILWVGGVVVDAAFDGVCFEESAEDGWYWRAPILMTGWTLARRSTGRACPPSHASSMLPSQV